MINSVTKPSTQVKAAVDNIPYTDLRVMEEMDFHAFGNFNRLDRNKENLYMERTHNFWKALIGTVDMKLHHNQNWREEYERA